MIENFISFRDNVQLYHWNTKDYARHVAAGELYNTFQTLLDGFVETLQKNKRIKLLKGEVEVYELNNKTVIEYLEHFLIYLTSLEKKYKKRTDLLNILADMITAINKTLYLFGLN